MNILIEEILRWMGGKKALIKLKKKKKILNNFINISNYNMTNWDDDFSKYLVTFR